MVAARMPAIMKPLNTGGKVRMKCGNSASGRPPLSRHQIPQRHADAGKQGKKPAHDENTADHRRARTIECLCRETTLQHQLIGPVRSQSQNGPADDCAGNGKRICKSGQAVTEDRGPVKGNCPRAAPDDGQTGNTSAQIQSKLETVRPDNGFQAARDRISQRQQNDQK